MRVFFGAAIQGVKTRGERSDLYRSLIGMIKQLGHQIVSEHTATMDYEQTAKELERAIGPLPPDGMERRIFVRNKMIEAIEGDIDAAIFEVSIPSLGTGVEMAHAYLRPRMGLAEIPILSLYEKDYWPNKLSSMILGISPEVSRQFRLKEFKDLEQARQEIEDFLSKINE